jgi:hypothetical protein
VLTPQILRRITMGEESKTMTKIVADQIHEDVKKYNAIGEAQRAAEVAKALMDELFKTDKQKWLFIKLQINYTEVVKQFPEQMGHIHVASVYDDGLTKIRVTVTPTYFHHNKDVMSVWVRRLMELARGQSLKTQIKPNGQVTVEGRPIYSLFIW